MTRSISLFVYGTLKKGHKNHARYFHGVTDITDARLRGRLFTMPQGYPMMVVPEDDILATGTSDPVADLETQTRSVVFTRRVPVAAGLAPRYDGWKDIPGELVHFDDLDWRLATLDELEGFRPDGASLYRRVLVPLTSHPGRVAWTYVAPADMGGEIRRHLVEIDQWTLAMER